MELPNGWNYIIKTNSLNHNNSEVNWAEALPCTNWNRNDNFSGCAERAYYCYVDGSNNSGWNEILRDYSYQNKLLPIIVLGLTFARLHFDMEMEIY